MMPATEAVFSRGYLSIPVNKARGFKENDSLTDEIHYVIEVYLHLLQV